MQKNWGFRHSLSNHLTFGNVSTGFISGFLAITGASLLVLEAAKNGGYSLEETLSWVFTVYFFGGLFSIILPSYFKVPLTGAHSLSGITYLATITPLFSFNELIAGFLLSGILILILGISGGFIKILKILPVEIISSMLAGMILHTLLSLTTQLWDATLIVISATVAFFLTSVFTKKIPGIFIALLISFLLYYLTESIPSVTEIAQTSHFKMYQPDFSFAIIFVVAIPLSILILSNDLIVGVNALNKEGYELTKTNVITLSGIFSVIGSIFGSHCTNLAGIMTSICSDPSVGKKEYRFVASVVSGIVLMSFAFFASYLIPFIMALPKGLPAIITFLTLYGVFISAFKTSISNKSMYVVTIPTLLISASNIHIFIFNGPILGLLVGLGITFTMKVWNKRIRGGFDSDN